MVDYESIYRALFNGISEAILSIDRGDYSQARTYLVKAQTDAEAIFADDEPENNAVSGTCNITTARRKLSDTPAPLQRPPRRYSPL